ncbi:MAG: hypothetical protein IT555_01300 [Acetobacteraceae bacterium]|nr:hypothetical protein [Acetobacteraceae bacterium]
MSRREAPLRSAALVLLALGTAASAWILAGLAGEILGSAAYWPLDRLGAVLAALAGLEAVLARWRQ